MALTDPSTKPKSKPSNSYLKYSTLGIQMLAAIGVFGWLGYLLDGQLKLKFPVFMLLFGFMAFGGMMYQIYRTINRNDS